MKKVKNLLLSSCLLTLAAASLTANAEGYHFVQKIKGIKKPTPSEPLPPVVYGSCKEILDAGASTGDGVYMIKRVGQPNEEPFYCDMTSDGGGWTLMTAQFESNPIEWNEGMQFDYDPSLATKKSFAIRLAPTHTQVSFGKDLVASFVDYFDSQYTVGNINLNTMTGKKTGDNYQIYRNTHYAIGNNDPEVGGVYSNTSWNNTMILDKTNGTFYSWVFAPRNTIQANRGVGMNGGPMWTNEDYAWTIWVR